MRIRKEKSSLFDFHFTPSFLDDSLHPHFPSSSDDDSLKKLLRSLKPFNYIYYIFGFDLLNNQPNFSRFSLKNVFLIVYHVFLLPLLLFSVILRCDVFFKYYVWMSVNHGALVVGVLCIVLSSALSYLHTLFNLTPTFKFIRQCLANISCISTEIELEQQFRRIRRWSLILTLALLCFFILVGAITVLNCSKMFSKGALNHVSVHGDDDHGSDHHQHHNNEHKDDKGNAKNNKTDRKKPKEDELWCPNCWSHLLQRHQLLHFLLVLVDFLTYSYLFPFLVTAYSAHLLFSLLLRTNFEVLERFSRNNSEVSLAVFQNLHRQRCHTLALYDSLQSFNILQWIIFECISLTFVLRRLVVLKPGDTEKFVEYAAALLFAIYLFTIFCLKYIVSAQVNNKVFDSLYSIKDIDNFDDIYSYSQPATAIQNKFQMYTSRLSLSPPALTAWGFFTINKSFLVSVVGTLLTYSLVLKELSTDNP